MLVGWVERGWEGKRKTTGFAFRVDSFDNMTAQQLSTYDDV